MKTYINGLLLLLLLSACKVSKDVQTPKNVVPDTFRNATHTADTTSIGDMQWKNFFADATLQNLIDSAIERNYDMQLAVKNIEASRLLFRQTKWNNVPQVDATVQATINRPSNNSLNGLSLSSFGVGSSAADDYTSYLSLSWEADIWGKIRSKSKAALAEYLSTIEAKKAVQTTLVNNVAQGYYNLLMLDEQLKIAQSNARLNDSTLRIIKLQYNSGQVTLLAVQQAEAQLLTAQSLVQQFE